MLKLFSPAVGILNRIQRRYAQARPGSVLILVVVLVVLLALLGTALLSTTRNDRYTAAQNTSNTQISLLVEAVKTMAQAMVADDLFGVPPGGSSTAYRPPDETAQIGEPDYKHYDSSLADLYLADRAPKLITTLGNQIIAWHGVTWPAMTSTSGRAFDSPDPDSNLRLITLITDWSATRSYKKGEVVRTTGGCFVNLTGANFATDLDAATGKLKAPNWRQTQGKDSFVLAPAYKTIAGRIYPALVRLNLDLINTLNDPNAMVGPFIAADADGDGIADSGLFRLNVNIEGVEYYGAIRIVDNSAAVNVNTAFSRHSDATANRLVDAFNQADFGTPGNPANIGAANLGMFKSHVGLLELLFENSGSFANAWRETLSLMYSRTGDTSAFFDGTPFEDPSTGSGTNATPRSDFIYRTRGDLWEHQLATRLQNPGYNTQRIKFSPFSMVDQLALAYRQTLVHADTGLSRFESAMLNAPAANGIESVSLFDRSVIPARSWLQLNPPFAPNEISRWFDLCFNHERVGGNITIPGVGISPLTLDPTQPRALRSLLTTHNAVANLAPRHDMELTDSRRIPPENKIDMPVTDTNLAAAPPDPRLKTDLMPNHSKPGSVRTPARTNINTAPFGELWRAFWEVMVDQSTHEGTPFGTPITPASVPQRENTISKLWDGNRFSNDNNGSSIKDGAFPFLTDPNNFHQQRMFRSSIRDFHVNASHQFRAHQQLLLRAALAAVNAEDLRDSDLYTVTHRMIHLELDRGGSVVAKVHVFGTERQPFITEVFVSTDITSTDTETGSPNDNGLGTGGYGYVAIELYNPYPDEIDISGWAIAIIDRRRTDAGDAHPNGSYPLRYFLLHPGGPKFTDSNKYDPVTEAPWVFPPGTTIPGHSFAVLENEGASAPNMIKVPSGVRIKVPNLHWVINGPDADPYWESRGGEFVLLRPAGPRNPASPNRRLEAGEWAPVDCFDFTGIFNARRSVELGGAESYYLYHYRRETGQTATSPNWKFVYPGHYVGSHEYQRHQGMRFQTWYADPAQGGNPPPTYVYGGGDLPEITLGEPNPSATYPTQHVIQIANVDTPGPHRIEDPTTADPMTGSPPQKPSFPFGGYARNGDMLQVPFIGSYVVVVGGAADGGGGELIEVNPITIDSVFADDTQPGNDDLATGYTPGAAQTREQVGRFVPVTAIPSAAAPIGDDLNPVGTYDLNMPPANKWHYRWAMRLFDYLTVDAPSNDYMANAPPQQEWSANLGYKKGEVVQVTPPGGKPSEAQIYVAISDVPATAGPPSGGGQWLRIGPAPIGPVSGHFRQPVKNSSDHDAAESGSPDANKEDTVPVHGLINLNTAPWKVLAAIPWVPAGQDTYSFNPTTGLFLTNATNNIDDNTDIARAIVAWRDGIVIPGSYMPGKGPFRSLFDLYRVTDATGKRIFLDIQQAQAGAAEPGDSLGEFSPYDGDRPGTVTPVLDGVRYDFEEQCLLMNRVSNLLTTRSDSFTAYILIQGWRSVGSSRPELVVQRRAAFLLDRSNLTETNNRLNQPVNVPNE
ncbi:hypothetical protein [Fontivita pretiosa]|uniref:hypothetical protein n=1 Tax=Fontivita pretiosa TaxID=2989684 RepID=UPI003D180049